jgi:2',3'-cyclic-nucleotide 2'-phosphodiesterase (5'-nucleotidase family)
MRRIMLCLTLTFVAVFSISVHAERECPVRVTLLDVNDVYQFAPVDNGARGGIARVSTLRSQILAESPHTLFLLAGDTISHKMLVGAKFLIQPEQGQIESEVLQKAVSSVRSIAPQTDGRIKRLDPPRDQTSCH